MVSFWVHKPYHCLVGDRKEASEENIVKFFYVIFVASRKLSVVIFFSASNHLFCLLKVTAYLNAIVNRDLCVSMCVC